MRNMIRTAFTGALLSMLTLFGISTGADAAVPLKAGKSVCKTGFRGQPAYDRLCLKTGTARDGLRLWLGMPLGKKGHETRDLSDRRSVCKYGAKMYGSVGAAVREINHDMAYDRFRNHNTVLGYAGAIATADCISMGTVKRSALPSCRFEDGSSQKVCFWSDGSGVALLNLDHGRWSFYPHSDRLVMWW